MKKSRLESQNFLSNIITLLIISFGVWNVEFNINPDETAAAILSQNWEYILSMTVPSAVTLVIKLIKKNKENAIKLGDLIKSPNFWNQVITIIAMIFATIGIIIPDTAPQVITDAIFAGSIVTLIGAIVTQVLTPIWYFFTSRNNP